MEVYTAEETAELLKIHKRTVLNEINRGNLKAKMIGNKYRITGQAINEYMEQPDPDKEQQEEVKEPEPAKKEDYLTVKEVASMFDVTKRAVHYWIESGKIEAKKGKNKYLINKTEVEKFKKSKGWIKINNKLIITEG